MPDRDYYLKDEDRFKEARAKYREHVQRLFMLAGSNEEAKAAAETVMRMEKRWRRRRSTTSRCAIRSRRITR